VATVDWSDFALAKTFGVDDMKPEHLSAYLAITLFGLIVAGVMWLIKRWHASNQVKHADELERLLAIARNDNLHG
jgi:hypothetical protein